MSDVRDKQIYLLQDFHPKTKPVLWRILITQLFLYNAIRNLYDASLNNELDFNPIKTLPQLIRKPEEMDWRKNPFEAHNKVVLVNPYKAVEKYLSSDAKLRELCFFTKFKIEGA